MIEKTHFEHIVGGTKNDKEEAAKVLQEYFEGTYRKLANHQIEKTSEDLEVLKITESLVDEIVTQYGGTPKSIPLDQIYLLEPDGVFEATDGKQSNGVFSPLGLKIGVDRNKANLLFACSTAHELFHLKSYKSARVGKTGEDVRLYRSGITLTDRKDDSKESGQEKQYFEQLEEAIVAECVKKFYQEVGKNSLFVAEAEAVKKISDWVVTSRRRFGAPEETKKIFASELEYVSNPQELVAEVLAYSDNEETRQEYTAGSFDYKLEKGEVETFERYEERSDMYKLLDTLVENSNGKYESRDQVFNEFAKANFSGNYIPLARIVEDILGKGSFRKLAEEFSRDKRK